MGGTSSKALTPQAIEKLLTEYHLLGGISERNHVAGWSDSELTWLLVAFSSRCTELQEIIEQSPRGDPEQPNKKASTNKKQKHRKSCAAPMSIHDLTLAKQSALKYIVVFNQSFVNYPSLSDRFWNLLDCTGVSHCNFIEYAGLMYKIVRGSWEQRVEVAFYLFDTDKDGFITLQEVIDTVTEISEFICNVARGVLTMNEFNRLKLSEVHRLFAGTKNGELSFKEFTKVAEYHQSLFGCSEILDMVFGRVIRKMEMDMKRDHVFGRYLHETALGNAKDITGDMPFVPEVIATAIHFLRKHKALGTPELFRISVSRSLLDRVKEGLNKGMTLRSYLRTYGGNPDDQVMLLASIIKTYCLELKEPAFTEDISRKIIAVEESTCEEEQKLAYFCKVFATLPTPNRYFLGTLLPFLKEVSDAQIARGASGCMSSSNLGVVFAPCTLYSPKDPTCGATSAPTAFSRFINHCELFKPVQEIPVINCGDTEVIALRKQLEAVQLERDTLRKQLAFSNK